PRGAVGAVFAAADFRGHRAEGVFRTSGDAVAFAGGRGNLGNGFAIDAILTALPRVSIFAVCSRRSWLAWSAGVGVSKLFGLLPGGLVGFVRGEVLGSGEGASGEGQAEGEDREDEACRSQPFVHRFGAVEDKFLHEASSPCVVTPAGTSPAGQLATEPNGR